MARLTKRSAYAAIPVVDRRIYKEGAVETQGTVERIDKVFGRRYTTWREVDGSRAHVVRAGETLHSLARRYYGDSNLWYVIADFNVQTTFYPLDLTENSVLVIPPQSLFGLVRSQL